MTNLYCDKVFERFAHFESLNVQVTGMQEVIDPLSAVMICLFIRQRYNEHRAAKQSPQGLTSDCAISLSW